MKKTTLLTALFLLFSFMGFAQEWHGITSDSPTKMKKTLVSSTENEIVVNVNLDGFYTNEVKTPEGLKVTVYVDDMPVELEAGAPQVSYDVIPVMIGDLAEMNVNVIKSSYVDFENVEVAPSKGNISRQINPDDVPYTYGAMYQQDAFWPAAQANLEAPYIVRDFRGQNIMVHPFAYNPVTKTLRVYTSMTIAMKKVSDNGENQKAARKGAIKMSGEQKAEYTRRFINFEESGAKYPFLEDDGEMLVICADQFMESMQPFVEWKNKSGRPTTMVSVTTAGGNNADAIKSYISNYYNDANHDLVYVLFVGDYEHITPHPFSYSGGSYTTTEYSDIWFGLLEGNDYYPEVFVGRFSAQTNTHVTSQVNKVLFYERDMQSDVTFGDKGLGIGAVGAGSGHYGEDDYQHIDYIRDTLLHYTYTNVTELHQGGSGSSNATATGISNVINSGVSVINYCNHGSETGWGVADYSCSNVNALTNDNKYPIVFSVACLVGKFNYGGANGECFAESWMRATNNSTGVPTGAIGGMFSWISQPWIPPMYGQDEMVDILTEWKNADHYNHTMAGVTLNGAMGILDFGSSKEGAYVGTQHSWLLFGDPSLMVRTANPVEMNVTVNPQVLLLGMNQLEVTADVDYAIATLSLNGEVIASGKIINGSGTLTFPAISNVGTADLIIVGYNKVTYVGTVDLLPAEGPYMTVSSYALNVPQADYGETVDMNIDIKNVGVASTSNLNVVISTENEFVTITESEGAIATINPDQIVTVEGFQFTVANNVPDKTKAQFDIVITDATHEWTGKVVVELHAPVLALESLIKTDDDVTFTFKNEGTAPFYGGTLSLTSCSPDLVITPDVITFEEAVAGGETKVLSSALSYAETVAEGTTFEVAYNFITGLFEMEDIFTVNHGVIMEDFESGVFGEGWSFSAQYAWTIVDNPTKGTKCARSSNYHVSNSESFAELTVNVVAAGNLTFLYRVSCEGSASNPWDKLTFYMDGNQMAVWTGDMESFEEYTQPVTPGEHTFKWSYTKDGSVDKYEDRAWIDDIKFPPTAVVTFLTPASNLEALVNGANVALAWIASPDADNYVIKRNGETIATVAETSYNDVLPKDGVYTYAVYAAQNGGQLSAPVTATIEAEFDGVVEENATKVSLYPNPAENELNIFTNAQSFEYQMINSLGQVVMSGVANGNAKLNVSELGNGVYFLKVVANGNADIQKVIIK